MRVFASLALAAVLSGTLSAQPSAPTVWRGTYRFAGGTPTFQPCGATARLTVKDDSSMGEMTTILSMVGADRRPSVFMEVRGAKDGTAIRILEIRRAEGEGRGCAENLKTTAFKARGNEPFWSLDASSSGVRFQRADDAKPLTAPYVPFEKLAAGWGFSAEINKTRLAVVIRPERCNDGMSGSVFPMTAEIEYGTARYKGCAYAGDLGR